MMHESTVVGLSGPCHHQPPTCPRPTPPSVHASLGNQFRFVPIQRALPPVDHPPQVPTDSQGSDARNPNPISVSLSGGTRGSWQRPAQARIGTRARARAGARAVEELLVLQPAGA